MWKSQHIRSLVITCLLPMQIGGAQDPFNTHVRSTDPLSPADQRHCFRLPPGFEIQLVAAEPQIAKPLNMAFDARGRLWITETTEYPFPAPLDRPGRDAIKILEDTNGDGQADKITTFADGLNIPMGIYPYHGGVVAFSIPYIWSFHDTDGDDVADRRIKLYGPFGYEQDTHGLNNAFRRGFDGWLYACHGFNNTSTVQGADGHTITMQSGNTYRMRMDGSRIEQFTWGQVNPFGMTFDPLGNLFTADCHSKPIHQLLRGGYYPSFGKPHDGLGFVPPMMEHTHGSTAIAGIACYNADVFPEEYRGNLFTGNVVTSRVNRNSLTYHGSTIVAHEEADFVATTDPWFRPVDLQVSPDGALYIADFYNRIIGHYEVPLDHPGRDRHRGRIWRVVYTGQDDQTTASRQSSTHADASIEQLIGALADRNFTCRAVATDLLVDKHAQLAIAPAKQAFAESPSCFVRSHALWVLHRLGACSEQMLTTAMQDAERIVRVHAIKMLSETTPWSDTHQQLVLAGLRDPDAFVKRGAAQALSIHPAVSHVRPLLDLLAIVPREDDHLRHVVRMALRDQFQAHGILASLQSARFRRSEAQELATVAVASPTSAAATFLLFYLKDFGVRESASGDYLRHAVRYLPDDQTDLLVNLIEQRLGNDVDRQLELLQSIEAGRQRRGAVHSPKIAQWAERLVERLLDSFEPDSVGWTNRAMPGTRAPENPWVLERRLSVDGDSQSLFLCSLPSGEESTGTLRSPIFTIPKTFSFHIAGHSGRPDQPPQPLNFVRLRHAKTDEILAETIPPGRDTAQRVQWDLLPHAGQLGYLEIVDGDEGQAFAWIAVGRLAPPVVGLPTHSPQVVARRWEGAAEIVAGLRLTNLSVRLAKLVISTTIDLSIRQKAAEACLAIVPDSRLAALAGLIGEATVSAVLRERISAAVVDRSRDDIESLLIESFRSIAGRTQTTLAERLVASRDGAELLLDLVAKGHASPRLLTETSIRTRLVAAAPHGFSRRIESLTAGQSTPQAEIQDLIDRRRAAFANGSRSVGDGAKVFAKHCAACHQIEGHGAVIGPQLDGIGHRGAERLIEDILDPNRNVDAAFRTLAIVTSDGKVLTGLLRREEGETLVLADHQGREFLVPKDRIEQQLTTGVSLMPEPVAGTLPAQEFFDLIAFLLTKRGSAANEEKP